MSLEFRLLEEDEARLLKEEALEELRRNLAARPARDPVRQALVRRLVRLNNDWRRLAGELLSLLSRRDSLGEFLELARRSSQPEAYQLLLQQRYRLALAPLLQTLADGFRAAALGREWPRLWQELGGTFQGGPLPPEIPGTEPGDLPAWQAIASLLLTQGGEPRKRLTRELGFPAGFPKASWPQLFRELPPAWAALGQCRQLQPAAALPEEAQALQDLVILLGEALAAYESSAPAGRPWISSPWSRPLSGCLATRDPSEILLRLDLKLRHLLVDEFQDTSRNQMKLLCRIMAGWQAGEGRTLTVVGDPKQSIYGLRDAKPGFLRNLARAWPAAEVRFPLESLQLTTNFRASRTLIHWANAVFSDVLAAE